MCRHGTMRHVLEIPHCRRRAGQVQDAGVRLPLRFDRWIGRVDHAQAIDVESIFPHAGRDRGRERPHAVISFGKREFILGPLGTQRHLLRRRGLQAKRDLLIRCDLRRKSGVVRAGRVAESHGSGEDSAKEKGSWKHNFMLPDGRCVTSKFHRHPQIGQMGGSNRAITFPDARDSVMDFGG